MTVYFKALASIFASPKAWGKELHTRLPENGVDQFWLKHYTPTLEPEAGTRLRRYIRNAVLVWIIFVVLGYFWLATSNEKILDLGPIFEGIEGINIIIGLRNVGLAIGTLAAGLLAVITLANSLNRTVQSDENIANERRKSDAEIFARSADQLASEKMPARLGALYALEALAKDALDREGPGSHLARQILETLAAFIREQSHKIHQKKEQEETADDQAAEHDDDSPYLDEDGNLDWEKFYSYISAIPPAPEDIQAAFKIIVRSFPVETRPDGGEGQLDLSHAWLTKINMPNGSDLTKLILRGAHMQRADLSGAHMEKADLIGAHMQGANLRNAHMERADLLSAHMRGANLIDAHMQEACLSDTHMQGAHLSNTDFEDVRALKGNQLASAQWSPEHSPINVPERLLPLPHDGKGNPVKPDAGEEEEG